MALPVYRIDLHTHSDFSPDGRGTPEALVRSAAARGACLYSLTDHNHFGGVLRAQKEAAALGLPFLTGAEFDLQHPATGRGYHFLFYGFDPRHPGLAALAREQAALYEASFLAIHPHLSASGMTIDLDALRDDLRTRYPGNPEPALNQWHAAEWLFERGEIANREVLRERITSLRRENPSVRFNGRFRDLASALPIARDAGATVVLAHVARYFPGEIAKQIGLIERLLEEGIDGFELHHPSNRQEPEFTRLTDAARQLGCVVTAGSDTHDALGAGGAANPAFGAMEIEEWAYARLRERFNGFS
ncbi:MAG TPA: PHP domain-containing protein [Chthoniobacteraceae bacterium]|nr:PHP domain-containing protein [Chthoniobacteraceae bacterium]